MPEIDVGPDVLLALARRLQALSDDLDRRRDGVVTAVLGEAAQFGQPVAESAFSLADACDTALVGLVGDYREMAELLSVSAGVYVAADEGRAGRRNPVAD